MTDVPQRRTIAARRDPFASALPSWSEQIRVRESWLDKRHEMLLGMMRRHDLQMWIVVNEEFHNDPLAEFIAPPRPYTGNRDFFIFVDTGGTALRRIAVTGYSEDNLKRWFESPDEPRPITTVLPELVKRYQPKRIALGSGGKRGVTRSLSHDTWVDLTTLIGPTPAARGPGGRPHRVPRHAHSRGDGVLHARCAADGVAGEACAVQRGHHPRSHHRGRRA
jgi:hypothetical protein